MPKVKTMQTNFTAGEFSPRLYGRTDIARYNNAVKLMENAYPLIYGGAVNRPGSLYVAPVKDSSKDTVLVPFVYNVDQAYILEFGDFYMRIFKDNAQIESSPGVPYEIVTPFGEAVLRKIDFQQSADTMFIECETIYPQRLQRFGDADWAIGNAPIKVEPFDEIGLTPATTLTLSLATVGTGRTATAGSASFLESDVGRFIIAGPGLALITAFTSTTVVTVSITTAFRTTSFASGEWTMDSSPQTLLTPSAASVIGTQINLTLSANGWRAGDVGKYVRINSGLVLINGITSALIATGIIKESLQTAAAAPALAWSLNQSIWGGVYGYPRTGLLHTQRWYLAGSTRYPQSLAGSQTASLFNFQLGTADDDGFLFKIAQSQDQILHLIDIRQILTLGGGGVFSVSGGVEKPITPTNIQINSQTDDGGCDVRPLKIGNEIYYVSRSQKRLLTATYKLEIEGFDVVNISKIADHISNLGLKEMTWQKDPDNLLMIVLNDGTLATVTIDREENVTGWARHITQGSYESLATIPVAGTQQTWQIVTREVDGQTLKYVEYIEPDMYLDSAIMGTAGMATEVWGGLDHLEGLTVSVLGDGFVLGEFVVSGGEVTLPTAVTSVQIGLPYTATIELLPLEFGSESGSSMGSNMRNGEAIIKIKDTLGCKINNDVIPFRSFGDNLDTPVEPFTGIKKMMLLGWDDQEPGVITIIQDQPLPLHVQSVVRKVTVND